MFRFDHAVISVDDLDTAMQDFTQAGFNVLPGGVHASGATHNALIVFADGSYLELMALTGEKPRPDSADYSYLLRQGEGFVGCALAATDLKAEIAAMQQRGLTVSDAIEGGRLRPDGTELRWKTASIGSSMSPFFIEDITARNLRVPDDDAATTHPNQTTGITRVTIIAADMDAHARHFERITGTVPASDGTRLDFAIDGCTLSLIPPEDDAMRVYSTLRPEAPCEVTLRTEDPAQAGLLTISQTHQARLLLETGD